MTKRIFGLFAATPHIIFFSVGIIKRFRFAEFRRRTRGLQNPYGCFCASERHTWRKGAGLLSGENFYYRHIRKRSGGYGEEPGRGLNLIGDGF